MEKGFSKLFNKKDVSDPFVDVKLGQCRIAKTRVIDNSLDPNWDELFKVEVCHHADNLIFDVRDKDHASTEVIGEVVLPLQQLLDGQTIDGWFQIKKSSRTRTKVHGELKHVLCQGSPSNHATLPRKACAIDKLKQGLADAFGKLLGICVAERDGSELVWWL